VTVVTNRDELKAAAVVTEAPLQKELVAAALGPTLSKEVSSPSRRPASIWLTCWTTR